VLCAGVPTALAEGCSVWAAVITQHVKQQQQQQQQQQLGADWERLARPTGALLALAEPLVRGWPGKVLSGHTLAAVVVPAADLAVAWMRFDRIASTAESATADAPSISSSSGGGGSNSNEQPMTRSRANSAHAAMYAHALVRVIIGEDLQAILKGALSTASSQTARIELERVLASPAILQLMLMHVAAVAQSRQEEVKDRRQRQRLKQLQACNLRFIDALGFAQQPIDIAAGWFTGAGEAGLRLCSVMMSVDRVALHMQQQRGMACIDGVHEQQQRQEQEQQRQQLRQKQEQVQQSRQQTKLLLQQQQQQQRQEDWQHPEPLQQQELPLQWTLFLQLLHGLVQLELVGSCVATTAASQLMQLQLSHLHPPLHDNDLQQLCLLEQDLSSLVAPLLQLLSATGQASGGGKPQKKPQAAETAFTASSKEEGILTWVFLFGK
jgi:hypothetical protein